MKERYSFNLETDFHIWVIGFGFVCEEDLLIIGFLCWQLSISINLIEK